MKNNVLKRKLIWAFWLNLAIVVLEIVGVFLSVQTHGKQVFLFYTQLSNYFALLTSAIFCVACAIALTKKSYVASWIHNLRYVSTCCLTLTISVVLFILLPMLPGYFSYLMIEGASLIQHVSCPIISIISLLLFENQFKLKRRSIVYALVPTIVYGMVLISLNLFRIIIGPYPFFFVYVVPWYFSTFCISGIVLGSYFIAIGLYFMHNRKHNRALDENVIYYEEVK